MKPKRFVFSLRKKNLQPIIVSDPFESKRKRRAVTRFDECVPATMKLLFMKLHCSRGRVHISKIDEKHSFSGIRVACVMYTLLHEFTSPQRTFGEWVVCEERAWRQRKYSVNVENIRSNVLQEHLFIKTARNWNRCKTEAFVQPDREIAIHR